MPQVTWVGLPEFHEDKKPLYLKNTNATLTESSKSSCSQDSVIICAHDAYDMHDIWKLINQQKTSSLSLINAGKAFEHN